MGSKKIEKPRQKHKKGLWSPDEDQRLRDYILKHGLGSWSSVPINAGLQRNGKSCRLRWINYLRPGLKRGMFTPQEEDAILTLHGMLGNKWSQIAQHLPGRTDNEIKNHWHSYLKKKVAKEGQSQAQNEYPSPNTDITESSLSSLKSFESFEPTEGTQISGAPGEAPQSNLPKLLFAEWLSLDQFQGQCSGNYGESAEVSKDAHCDLNSSFLDPLSYGLLLNEGLFGGDLTGDSAFEMFYPQFRSDNRFSENGFVSFMAEEDMCSQLNVNDVMYV